MPHAPTPAAKLAKHRVMKAFRDLDRQGHALWWRSEPFTEHGDGCITVTLRCSPFINSDNVVVDIPSGLTVPEIQDFVRISFKLATC